MEGLSSCVISTSTSSTMKVVRCMDWVQTQNNQKDKQSLKTKNDIQFIIQMNAERKNFLLSAAEDEVTVPAGIGETSVEPDLVPLRCLRFENLHLECGWRGCGEVFSNYNKFQIHMSEHIQSFSIIENNKCSKYICLWDVCGHEAFDFNEMERHINYHAYHTKLMAVGFNGRATLKLPRCTRDSTKRNKLPPLLGEHCCFWTRCEKKFNSIQNFFDHVKSHIQPGQLRCSWAGCGSTFPRRVQLMVHVASHTGERKIACYHCGHHFANNRKLTDHLRRQNVDPNSRFACSLCGSRCATEYLLSEHSRMHVSAFACTACDMTAPSRAALAQHVRYRHLPRHAARSHACARCPYRAITKSDLRKHMLTHERKIKKERKNSDDDTGESDVEVTEKKKQKSARKYACHLCPEKEMKVFTRGTKLTTHLVNKHGAQWPFGYSRFRYQISSDGLYRLTTTRYEVLEVSKKIVDGYSDPKQSLAKSFEFTLQKTSSATDYTPTSFKVSLKDEDVEEEEEETQIKEEHETENTQVEILMCDVDNKGNIIKTEIISQLKCE